MNEAQPARKMMHEDAVYSLWATKNAELRAIGLPMQKDPLTE